MAAERENHLLNVKNSNNKEFIRRKKDEKESIIIKVDKRNTCVQSVCYIFSINQNSKLKIEECVCFSDTLTIFLEVLIVKASIGILCDFHQ